MTIPDNNQSDYNKEILKTRQDEEEMQLIELMKEMRSFEKTQMF